MTDAKKTFEIKKISRKINNVFFLLIVAMKSFADDLIEKFGHADSQKTKRIELQVLFG